MARKCSRPLGEFWKLDCLRHSTTSDIIMVTVTIIGYFKKFAVINTYVKLTEVLIMQPLPAL